MAQCKHCGQSGLLLRTNARGICKGCDAEVKEKTEQARERVREALIFARCLKSARDRALHLRRAMDSVRLLSRYDHLGYCEVRPSPAALQAVLEERLAEVQLEEAGTPIERPAASTVAGRVETPLPKARPWERRREARRRVGFPVRVDPGGIRARVDDISGSGVRVSSAIIQRPGRRMRLTLETPIGSVPAEGIVRWARRSRGADARGGEVAMGLEVSGLSAHLVGQLREEPPAAEGGEA